MLKKSNSRSSNPIRFKKWSRRNYAVFASLKVCVCYSVLSVSCSIVTLKAQPILSSYTCSSEDLIAVLEDDIEDASILDSTLTVAIDSAELQSAQQSEQQVVRLSEVNVHGEKRVPLSPMVQKISELSKLDIQYAGVQNIQDLLRYLPGVDIRSRGSENVQADLSLRGGTFDQSTVLLDGVNLTDPQTGHHSLNIPIPFSAIERIELYQGAGAWCYGVAPLTAAVNIIPRPLGSSYLELSASGGMYGYYQTEGHGQYSKGPWSVAADVGYTASDGFSKNTDFEVLNSLLRVGYVDPMKVGILKLSLGYEFKNFGSQNFYSTKYKEQYEKTKTFLAILQYSKVWGNWRVEAKAYWRQHHDRYDLFRYASDAPAWYAGPNMHRTDVAGVGAEAAYAWKRGGTTMFGVDYRYEHIYSNNIGVLLPDVVDSSSMGIKVPFEKGPFDGSYFYNRAALRQVGSGFVQHTYHSDNQKWKLAAGVLINGSSDYGAFVFGGVSAAYKLNRHWRWETFVNHSYRLPTFTDLYYKSATQTGNPNLDPEQALTAETNMKWEKSAFSASAGVFYRYGFKVIDWVRMSGDDMWYSQNLTKLHTIGAQVGFNYRPNIAYLRKVGFDYTYVYVSKNSGVYQSLYATDYLRNSFKFSIEHGIYGALGASWELMVNDRAGNYTDEAGVKKSYKPYALCNLRIYWSKPRYEIFVMASNLFNVKYFDLGNIEQPGIWVKAGAKIKIS